MAQAPDRYEPLPGPLGLPGFLWRTLGRTGRVLVVGAGAAVLVAVALLVPGARSGTDERAAQEAARRDAAREQRIATLVPLVQPRTGRAPDASRRTTLARLEADILADARARAETGEIRGPFSAVRCFDFPKRLGRSSPASGTAPTARLECIAVTARVPPSGRTTGSLIGQPFRARIDFPRGRYAWCRVVQRPGELSITRTPELKPAAACGG